MRWGCCGGIDQAEAAKQAGFDFLEVNIQGVLKGTIADDQWRAETPDVSALPLPIEAANCLVPGNMPIVGPQRDMKALAEYMQRVATRAKELGIERLVFGSGGARKRPDDVDEQTAFDQIVEFTAMAGEHCEKAGVMLVIEHLRSAETNTINKLDQAIDLSERANSPAVQLLIDSYHFGLEDETDDAIRAVGKRLQHVHVAEPVDRIQPGGHEDASKSFDFVNFFSVLKEIGYDQRISFEGKWTTSLPEAGPAMLAYVKDAWSKASV